MEIVSDNLFKRNLRAEVICIFGATSRTPTTNIRSTRHLYTQTKKKKQKTLIIARCDAMVGGSMNGPSGHKSDEIPDHMADGRVRLHE